MSPWTVALIVAVAAMALVPMGSVCASDDFEVSYDGISQDELRELLGIDLVDAVGRIVLESAGVNASGEGCPIERISAEGIRFGLVMDLGSDSGSDSPRKQMETRYTYYLELDLDTRFKAEAGGYDAFDEDVTGDSFPFSAYLKGDSGSITGHVRLSADVDMRETVSRQPYDPDLYAISSSTVIRTTFCSVDLEVLVVHGMSPYDVGIRGGWDARSVAVFDFTYPEEGSGVRAGDEVHCRWTSREDSADVSLEFLVPQGPVLYTRDVGDCWSGISSGAVPGAFFHSSATVQEIGGYRDAVSGPLKEFVRGEMSAIFQRDDGLDPFREPELVREDGWVPAVSLICAAVFVALAILRVNDIRYRRRLGGVSRVPSERSRKRPESTGFTLSTTSHGQRSSSVRLTVFMASRTSLSLPRSTGPNIDILCPIGAPSRSHMTERSAPFSTTRSAAGSIFIWRFQTTSCPITLALSPDTK